MPRVVSPGDKMQMRNMGELMHPGACASCGNGTCQEGYVDLGIYFDYEGNIYFCFHCLTQAAETAGMLSVPESQYLIEQNKEFATQTAEALTLLEDAKARLDEYDNLFKRAFSDSGVPTGSGNADNSNPEVTTESADEDGSTPSNITDFGDGKEPESSKSVKSGKSSGTVRTKRSNVEL